MRSLVQRRPDEQYLPVPRPPEPAPELSNAALARRLAREVAEEPITAPGVTGAQQWHQRGLAHYNAGRFQKAFDAFAEAYRLEPDLDLPARPGELPRADGAQRRGRRDVRALPGRRPLSSDVAKITSRIRKLRRAR